MKKYSIDNVCTGDHKADDMNSFIMAAADDFAEDMTLKDFAIMGKTEDFWVEDEDGARMCDEAQEIWDEYYTDYVDKLYDIINAALEIDAPTEEEKIKDRLGELVSMDVDEAYDIWINLTSENDNDMADHHFDMWQPLENSLSIKQMAEQL